MKKTTALLSTALLLISSTALADGYGPAGCGLGSLIIKSHGFVQVFAATTNGTFANQTFAISSGTSNCSGGGSAKASAKLYIENNRQALAKEIARGKGEAITNLATIAGCADSKAVGKSLKKDFKKIFPNQSATNESVSDAVMTTLSNGDLACSGLTG